MQTRSSDDKFCLSVCLSVCLYVKRVDCDETEEKSVQIFIPYERTFRIVFWEKEWLVGPPLLPEILGQTAPVRAKSYTYSYIAYMIHWLTIRSSLADEKTNVNFLTTTSYTYYKIQ